MAADSVALCVAGKLRDFPSAEVQNAWATHFLLPREYSLFFVVDEEEQSLVQRSSTSLHRLVANAIVDVAVQPPGANTVAIGKCNGGPDGRDGFNHRWMSKLFLRLPTCLMLIERHEQQQWHDEQRFAFTAFVRPDVIWSARVPHLAMLWERHRHGRDLLIWDDHMAVMRRRHAAAFFLGAAHSILKCAKPREWMAACGLHLVPRYKTRWHPPNASGLTDDVYEHEIGRFLENGEAPCTPLRLIAASEGVTICDCGLLFTVGGRCLTLDDAQHEESTSTLKPGTPPSARLANTRTHTWIGQRPSDKADDCSGSFNLDAATHRNFWLPRLPARLRVGHAAQTTVAGGAKTHNRNSSLLRGRG